MAGMATVLNINPAVRQHPVRVDAAAQCRPVRLRIGAFQLNPKSGELSSNCKSSVLQWQPLQLLLMLIERDGEVVTRGEIQNRIWGEDVIVDFDHSINTLVRKLRRALGDSAEAPNYIETLARRGYRLKVRVELVENPTANSTGTNAAMFSSIRRRAAWKGLHDGESAAPVRRLSLPVKEIAGATEHRTVVSRGSFRCRQRAFYNSEQRRNDLMPTLEIAAARDFCEQLVSAAPAERLDALRQFLALVTQVLEASSI